MVAWILAYKESSAVSFLLYEDWLRACCSHEAESEMEKGGLDETAESHMWSAKMRVGRRKSCGKAKSQEKKSWSPESS